MNRVTRLTKAMELIHTSFAHEREDLVESLAPKTNVTMCNNTR